MKNFRVTVLSVLVLALVGCLRAQPIKPSEQFAAANASSSGVHTGSATLTLSGSVQGTQKMRATCAPYSSPKNTVPLTGQQFLLVGSGVSLTILQPSSRMGEQADTSAKIALMLVGNSGAIRTFTAVSGAAVTMAEDALSASAEATLREIGAKTTLFVSASIQCR